MPLIGLAGYLISIRHCNTWNLVPWSLRPARDKMGVRKVNPKRSPITAWFTKSSTRGAAKMVQTEGQLSITRRIIGNMSLWLKRHRIMRSRGGITPRRTSPRIGLTRGSGTRKSPAFVKKISLIIKKWCRNQSSWLIHNGSDPWINSKGCCQRWITSVNRAAQACHRPKEVACSCKVRSLIR